MIIKVRVKDKNGRILKYIAEDNNKEYDIMPQDIINYSNKIENAIVTKSGEIRAKKGNRIINHIINSEHLYIEKRNTSVIGKPALIHTTHYQQLSGTQNRIIKRLKENNRYCKFKKNEDSISIDMKDLSAITALTGKELSLFERNDTYIIYIGECGRISIPDKESAYLINNHFKWIGHTHPGDTQSCLMPSDSDYCTLQKFSQKRSVIYNSTGQFYVFGMED
ncbi:MAG: hypothetical protein ACXAHE_03865 [Roseburia sp. 1XD42-69]